MALRTLGQLTPKYRSHLKMTWMHPEFPNLQVDCFFLTSHCLPYQEDYLSASPTSLLVHLLFLQEPIHRTPFQKNLPAFMKVQSQGHSLASILSFFFSSVKCLYILSKNIPCTGTVTSVFYFTADNKSFWGRKEGRKDRQEEGTREAWWRKEIYRTLYC